MKTIACIVVSEPWAFTWLGDRTVIRWTLDALSEVRGLDDVLVCGVPDFRHRLNGHSFAIDKIVSDADGREGADAFMHNLCNGNEVKTLVREARAVLIAHPKCPFITASRYEACVAALDAGSPDVVFTYPVSVLEGARLRPAAAIMPQIRATVLGSKPTATRTVEIGRIEAIDVSDPDGMRMAQSLVGSGMV